MSSGNNISILGAGFIGLNLIDYYFNCKNYKIKVLDRGAKPINVNDKTAFIAIPGILLIIYLQKAINDVDKSKRKQVSVSNDTSKLHKNYSECAEAC